VLNSTNIEQTLKQVVESYLQDVKSIEGSMLVKIKSDISGFPIEYPVVNYDANRLDQVINEALQPSIDASKADIHQQIASLIVCEVLEGTALLLGRSVGIIGAGATLSIKTLGVAVVASVIIDAFISYVWDWWKDPKGELAFKVNTKLDEANSFIKDKLKERMVEIANKRAVIRQNTILNLLSAQ